jgi:hypothetical protein
MDRNGIILTVCFVIELVMAIMIVFFFDILDGYLLPAIITTFIMCVIMLAISITEVVRSEKIGVVEKVLWIIGLVSVINLVGLMYIILRRWRVLSVNK